MAQTVTSEFLPLAEGAQEVRDKLLRFGLADAPASAIARLVETLQDGDNLSIDVGRGQDGRLSVALKVTAGSGRSH